MPSLIAVSEPEQRRPVLLPTELLQEVVQELPQDADQHDGQQHAERDAVTLAERQVAGRQAPA